ncbi:MAG: hypothetical protein ACRD3O_13230, partial [Terriglobia bacterium]
HVGYDRLPSRVLPAPPRAEHDLVRQKELAVAQRLVDLGYREIKMTSMMDPAESALFSELPSVALVNPLSQEASSLRTSAIPSMLAALKWNLDRDCEDMRFFEMGKLYWKSSDGPRERRVLALGLAGHRRVETVHDAARELDVFDLKGDLEALLEIFDIEDLSFRSLSAGGGDGGELTAGKPGPFEASEGRRATIGLNGEFLGGQSVLAAFGRLAEGVREDYKLRRPVWVAEINFERLLEFSMRSRSFHTFSKYPAVERDFSLRVPERVNFATITRALQRLNLPELLRVKPVDLFQGGMTGPQNYSLLLRATFQSDDHTLSGEEISAASQELLAVLLPLGIQLRS